jgi:glycyl-tRNA synthetase beta subunit
MSVEASIQQVEDTIDAKVSRFYDNVLVREAANQIKAECRANILQQVEAAGTNRGTRTLY